MNNAKLYKFAKSLMTFVDKFDSPQIVYGQLLPVMRDQKVYFEHLGAENTLKLIFLIYSFGKTKSFELGEKMLNNLTFLKVINNTEEQYEPECDNCGGDGRKECYDCDGTGREECEECDGEGEVDCWDCKGTGEIESDNGEMVKCDECDGSGKENCDECDGEGKTDCGYCNGSGEMECGECDGDGHLPSDETWGKFISYVTWNRNMIQRAELTAETLEPLFLESQIKVSDYFLELYDENVSFEFDSTMDSDSFYCCDVVDAPKLGFNYNMEINWKGTFAAHDIHYQN